MATVGGILLILLCVGCGNGGGGGGDRDGPEGSFEVKASEPADGQAVSPDLSETKGRIEVRFSEPLDAASLADEGSGYGFKDDAAHLLNTLLYRVPGKAEVEGRRLRFTPTSDDLAPQQYTLTLTTKVKSRGGQTLARERRVSFTVGPDVYEPIIRRTWPAHNQTEIPIDATLHAWFNEPLDPATVNASTVVVHSSGISPTAEVAGTVTLDSDGYELVFTPKADLIGTITMTLTGGESGIRDRAGIPYLASSSQKQSILMFSAHNPCGCVNPFAWSAAYFLDSSRFGVIDVAAYTGGPPMPGGEGRDVVNSSLIPIGDPGDIVLDPRVNGNGDTFAYVLDRDAPGIAVVNTFNSRLVGRIPIPGAAGLAVSAPGRRLYVTRSDVDRVAIYDISHATPGTNNWDTDPDDGSARRLVEVPVGRTPGAIAHAFDDAYWFACNTTEGTCSVGSDLTDTVRWTWSTGGRPREVTSTHVFPDGSFFACVTVDDGAGAGRAAIWWSGLPGSARFEVPGLTGPRGVAWDFDVNWFVACSDGDSVARIALGANPGVDAPSVAATYPTGAGPMAVALDPMNVRFAFTANRDDGTVSVLDMDDATVEIAPIPAPGIRMIATLMSP